MHSLHFRMEKANNMQLGYGIPLKVASIDTMAKVNKSGIETDKEDKTLSLYFFIKSDDPGLDKLPLKHTSADVNIVGVIADVILRTG